MNIEKRLEKLEQHREVSDEMLVIVVCYEGEPHPTDEEKEIAIEEFIEKYGRPSEITINAGDGETFARVNDELIRLPHSDRLRQLRKERLSR